MFNNVVRVLLVCAYLFIYSAHSVTIYVSSDTGNDAWTGLNATVNGTNGPLKTLWAVSAVLESAAYKSDPRKQVKLLGGTYYLNSTLTLNSIHNGSVWSVHNGAKPRIMGGVEVTSWTSVTDPNVLNLLPANARANVKQADLKAMGLSTFGSPYRFESKSSGMELFFTNIPMTLARYPNYNATNSSVGYVLTGAVVNSTFNYFKYTNARPASWKNVGNDTYMRGFFYYDWSDTVEKIDHVDKTSGSIYTKRKIGNYGVRQNQRYFYFNVLEELDTPGEYYINRTSGIIYFWPPSPISSTARTRVSVNPSALITVNAHNVKFSGITFEVTQGDALVVSGDNGTVLNCTVRNTGNHGIVMTGSGHTVANSFIKYIGLHGVVYSGGNRIKLIPSHSIIFNNDISDFARNVWTYIAGVHLTGVGHVVSHNHIYNSPHNAILCTPGNNHIIEYNEVNNVCRESGDVGAFYIGRDWTSQGHIIRYNYWHDIQGPGLYGASAIYFDDQNSGATVFGNVFFNVYRSILIGGGRDIIVDNNIFLNSTRYNIYADARGLTANLMYGTLFDRYYAMPTNTTPWNTTYPDLPNLMNDNPNAPKYNFVKNNIYNNLRKIVDPNGGATPYPLPLPQCCATQLHKHYESNTAPCKLFFKSSLKYA